MRPMEAFVARTSRHHEQMGTFVVRRGGVHSGAAPHPRSPKRSMSVSFSRSRVGALHTRCSHPALAITQSRSHAVVASRRQRLRTSAWSNAVVVIPFGYADNQLELSPAETLTKNPASGTLVRNARSVPAAPFPCFFAAPIPHGTTAHAQRLCRCLCRGLWRAVA